MGYFLALRGRIPQPLHTRRNEEDPSASQNDKVVALLPPTDKQQTCTLPFPPEIIALIISFLPPESATAFALICRTFYYQFLPPPSRPLTQPQRLALLTWLEQDTPSLYLCHGCVRLHTWRREPEPDPSNGGVARYDWHCNNRASHFCRPRPPSRPLLHNLDFHLARLVVNRHLHGKSHGPSLASALNLHDIHHKVEPNGVTINEAWDARVIRGELYLRAVVRVYHDRRDATALWDHLVGPAGAGWFPICRHVGLFGRRQSGEQAPKSRRLESDAADPEGGGAEMTIRRRGKISSCKYCYTDFWVDVGSLGENGWVLIMVAWYGLGRCRSPEEEEWHNFVHAWPRDISVPRICEGVAGVVYCVWRESQEGVSVDLGQLDARFVNDELVKPRVALAEKVRRSGLDKEGNDGCPFA